MEKRNRIGGGEGGDRDGSDMQERIFEKNLRYDTIPHLHAQAYDTLWFQSRKESEKKPPDLSFGLY